MYRRRPNFWWMLAVIGGLAYPPLVYFGLSRFPPSAIVLFGVALIGIRCLVMWRSQREVALVGGAAFVLAAGGLITLLALAPGKAAFAYPIMVSLATAGIFAASLVRPPTVIERIARIREPGLSASGVAYTRQVTIVWTIFLVGNAMIAAILAIWATVAVWSLWTGLVSYLLMGLLFLGEFGVRRIVRRRDMAMP